MDKTTFGNSKASRNLVEELERVPELKKEVSTMIHDCINGFKELKLLQDKRYKEVMSLLWRNHFVDKGKNFPYPINTFYTNVVVSKHRNFIRDNKNV